MSDPVTIPANVAPIDWLAAQKIEYATSPLARWPDRHSLPLLEKLAKFRAQYPDFATELTDYLFAAAGYAYRVGTTPLYSGDDIDRRSSMFAGFPWTSDEHPWPLHNGVASFPIVQLNLNHLELDAFPDLPDCLVQLWGGSEDREFEVQLRRIELVDIEGVEPDPTRQKSNKDHFGFEPDDSEQIGFGIKQGERAFVIPDLLNMIDEAASTELNDYSHQPRLPDDKMAEIREAFSALLDDPDVSGLNTNFGKKGYFGGAPALTQIAYSECVTHNYKCFLHIAGVPSLEVLFDGQATIFAHRDGNGQYSFDGYADR